ncbi:MAG: hypothetical protein QG608_198 [Actinomycetota bacterium]|nr:hypothetical protein [Actinomycetota bacterium]
MNVVRVELFDQSSSLVEMRLFVDGTMHTRLLDREALDGMLREVDARYPTLADLPASRATAELAALGEKVFAFLDGSERWLKPLVSTGGDGVCLRIDQGERLRHLPFELICRDGSFLAVAPAGPVLPVRSHRRAARDRRAANRALRVLFMAMSPEGVEPVLSYEDEEGKILTATKGAGVDLVVEESGTLEGLRETIESYGKGHFDVVHLSGHAAIVDGRPMFLAEDDQGGRKDLDVDTIARALAGQWPRLFFVSGCSTAGAVDSGVLPSMSEALVEAGAPLVLGWARPVGDLAASVFAENLYRGVAAGKDPDRCLVEARRHLYTEGLHDWHLLRVYADQNPLTPLVTPPRTKGRARAAARPAAQEFLDPLTQVTRVASRTQFVGRRRQIQRCLRTLRTPADEAGAVEGIVLHGMGGLGKSTLASRLLERLPDHRRAVWSGHVDEIRLRELPGKVLFDDREALIEAEKIMGESRIDLSGRLRLLFEGPLSNKDCLLVFDDFENGNLDERPDGTRVLRTDAARILPAVSEAIRGSAGPSRFLITSRYTFDLPAGVHVTWEGLETFTTVEQDKKLAILPRLGPDATTDPQVRQRAIEAACGNPRLLEWMDKIVDDENLDLDELLGAVEAEADRFRKVDIFAEHLLNSQSADLRMFLARAGVVDLPVPEPTLLALSPDPQTPDLRDRAVQLGLLEQGLDPQTEKYRYFVSNVLRPLLRPLLDQQNYEAACAAAAESLYQEWIDPDGYTEPTDGDAT